MSELARIEEIAKQLHRAMELVDFSDCACNLHGFPSKCCHHASSLLLVLFHKCGINGFEVVRGRDPKWIEEEQFHNWTQRENIIVAITADQFGKQYPPVIVGESQWHTEIFCATFVLMFQS